MNQALSFWFSLFGTLALAVPLLLAFFPVLQALAQKLLGLEGSGGALFAATVPLLGLLLLAYLAVMVIPRRDETDE